MHLKQGALFPLAIAAAGAVMAAVTILPFVPARWPMMVRIVAVYDVAVIAMLAFFWFVILTSDVAATRTRAAREDPGRNIAFAVVLVAVTFGFIAAFDVLLPDPNGVSRHQATTIYLLGFAAVVLGWLLIHTLFVFRYAHLYYRRRDTAEQTGGGLTFPGAEEPRNLDFAYFSFVLGMTFQVSDVQVTSPSIRALALAHGLISFGYNTAILALVVNLVAGLLH